MGSHRTTGYKYATKQCPSCGEPHEGYTGKLNADNEEYIVCGITGKPVRVKGVPSAFLWTPYILDVGTEVQNG